MAYTATQLITRAYYLSQVVARELQTVSAAQLADGLFLLNALLDYKSTDTRHIPYYTHYEFNAITGQEMYFVPDLLNVDTLTFNIGDVRFSMTEFTREQYFAISRVDNILSLPFSYRIERTLGGSNVYLYYYPADTYLLKMEGKFALNEVTINTDMSLTLDAFYIEFLRYQLAEYICCEYGVTFPDECKAKLDELQKKVVTVSPPDLSIQGNDYFMDRGGMDWQVANLTTGYWPF